MRYLRLILICLALLSTSFGAIGHTGFGGGSNTFTYSATATSDLKVVVGIDFTDNSMSTPAGWTLVTTGTPISGTGVWFVACNESSSSSDTSSGSWTAGGGTHQLMGESFSGTGVTSTTNCGTTALGAIAEWDANPGATYTYPSLTLTVGSGSSWVFAGAYNNSTGPSCTISGLTQFGTVGNVYTAFDTNGGVSTWPGGTCSGFNAQVGIIEVEILASGAAPPTCNHTLSVLGAGCS